MNKKNIIPAFDTLHAFLADFIESARRAEIGLEFPLSDATRARREVWPKDASTPGQVWRKLGDWRMTLAAIESNFEENDPARQMLNLFRDILDFIAFPVKNQNPKK